MEESVGGSSGNGGGGVQHEDEENTTHSTMSEEDEDAPPLDLPNDDVTPENVNIIITPSGDGPVQSNNAIQPQSMNRSANSCCSSASNMMESLTILTATATNLNSSGDVINSSSCNSINNSNRISSLRTDTTPSDIITRPSLESLDDESVEEDEITHRSYAGGGQGSHERDRCSRHLNRSSHSRPFFIGDDEELLSEENDAAFEDNPLSSEENDVLNDPDVDDLNNYRITLTETESVFPLNFSCLPGTPCSAVNPSFSSQDVGLAHSGASIASSLASVGNIEAFSDTSGTLVNGSMAATMELDSEPAQYVLKLIMAQFVAVINLKIEDLLLKDIQFNSCKSLQFGDDPVYDQLLESLYEVAEHSLPSILRGLFQWYDQVTSSSSRNQTLTWLSSSSTPHASSSAAAKQVLLDKRDLYVDFAFGMSLLQACKQLEKHPVEEELLVRIESIPFKHYFKLSHRRRSVTSRPSLLSLLNSVADLYAQLIGELVKTRFRPITTWFKGEFRNLKRAEASPERTQAFVCLIMGLRFFRVKMFPIQEFDMSFQFLHELAKYFQDPVLSKEKEIRHAFAGLLAEILLPVAAVVKNEVNIPAVKNLVKTYFESTRQAAEKKKHAVAMFPLVTCLLAISHTKFFTQQWTSFTNVCLSNLRNRDPKISRAALESLYRLLWVYMVRIKEDNVITGQKLQPIISNLFPKNSRNINPRDMPLIIYVKIIHFISQEKLDLAMREIIFELLQVSKLPKITITPERMIVGLRAFLVIADQLQQQPSEKAPPMPMNNSSLPSGCLQKSKRTFLTHTLTETAAMNCALGSYFGPVCRALGVILFQLDSQIGKPMLTYVMSTSPTKEHRDISSALAAADKKPKLDLFRACVAAIPRLLPQPLVAASGNNISGTISSTNEVLDLLCRLADHSEDELRALAISHMGNIVKELRDWRPGVITRLVLFITREIPDTMPATLESMLRILLQLMGKWRECLQSEMSTCSASNTTSVSTSSAGPTQIPAKASPLIFSAAAENTPKSKSNSLKKDDNEQCISALRRVEGLSLCTLCHLRPNTRRLAVVLLKEAHMLATDLKLPQTMGFIPVVVRMDQGLPSVLEKMLPKLSANERFWAATAAQPDLNWLCEKTSPVWCVNASYDLPFECPHPTAATSTVVTSSDNSNYAFLKESACNLKDTFDPWFYCIIHLVNNPYCLMVPGCVDAVNHAWNFVSTRINLMSILIDQTNPQELTGATLRRTPKRPSPINDYYLGLWRNYLTLACGAWSSTCVSRTSTLEASQSTQVFHQPAPMKSASGTSTEDSALLMASSNSSALCTSTSSPPNTTVTVEKRESIGHLLRNTIIPILRGEHSDLKEVSVQAIGFTSAQALRDAVDEFTSLVREVTDRRPDKRRIKKRAEMRLMLVRIFARISERGVISQCLFDPELTSSARNGVSSVAIFFHDLIESYKQCLEHAQSEMTESGLRDTKICFSQMIHYMINTAPENRGTRTVSSEIQRTLFDLTSTWCGTLGKIANGKSPPSVEQATYSEVELAALQAMCSVVGSEPDDRNTFLCEDSYIYTWLSYMLSSKNSQVYDLGCSTIEKLFKKNSSNVILFKWLMAQSFDLHCLAVSHACFKTIINVCSLMDCFELQSLETNAASLVLLALFFSDSSDLCIREMALQLLYFLGNKLLSAIDAAALSDGNVSKDFNRRDSELREGEKEDEEDMSDVVRSCGGVDIDESFLAATPAAYYKTQRHLSKELSRARPELTLGIFSEASCRFQNTSVAGREILLKCLLPWMENIELAEPSFMAPPAPNTPIAVSGGKSSPPPQQYSATASFVPRGAASCRDPTLHLTPLSWATGWGSTVATDCILNNLFYITVEFSSDHADSLKKLWQCLCNSFHDNCAIILRFMLQMSAISFRCPKLLAAAKSVVAYVAKGSKEHVTSFLLTELSSIEALPSVVKKWATAPFFRVIAGSSTSSSTSCGRTKSEATVAQIPLNLSNSVPSTSTVTKSSVANIDLSSPPKTSREKHSTLPPDFYQTTEVHHQKTNSIPLAAVSSTVVSVAVVASNSPATAGANIAGGNESEKDDTASSSERGPKTGSRASSRPTSFANYSSNHNPAVSESNLWLLSWKICFHRCNEQHAKPLPVPENVFFCPLAKIILHSSHQVPNSQGASAEQGSLSFPTVGNNYAFGMYALQRCFASLILCSHLLITEFGFDWTPHIPLFLHLSILGLDHGLPVVVTHARRTLINLILTQLETDADQASKSLLLKGTDLISTTAVSPHNHRSENVSSSYSISEISNDENPPTKMAEYLLHKISQPLWTSEDVAPRNQTISSAEKVSTFVNVLADMFENYFISEVPLAFNIRNDWADLSLKMALSSSSRHYASRSFQVYRGLEVIPVSRDVSDILIRLNDTVAETGEETQGYVVEILQTLSKLAQLICAQSDFNCRTNSNHSRISETLEEKRFHDEELEERATKYQKSAPKVMSSRRNNRSAVTVLSAKHKTGDLDVFYRRTSSYNGPAVEALRQGLPNVDFTLPLTGPASATLDSREYAEMKRRDLKARSQCLPRDFGNSLVNQRNPNTRLGIFEDKLSILCQIFWAVVSLLESDFEHEYLLGLKLLDQLLDAFNLTSNQHLSALCRVFHQMKWNTFYGLQPLVLKGLTLPSGVSLSEKMLMKFTPFVATVPFIDSNQRGLTVNIVSLLPMLFESYDDTNEPYLDCADTIASECLKAAELVSVSGQSRPQTSASILSVDRDEDSISLGSGTTPSAVMTVAWNNLATVMRMYNRQSHVKDSVSWLAAVCKYLGEAVPNKLFSLITYLSQLLERGPPNYQDCLLHMISSFIQIIDLQRMPKEKFNATTVNTLLHKFMLQNNAQWKNALSALKLIVTCSSTLCSPTSSQRRVQQLSSTLEEAVIYRRQIPGRTLSFTYTFPIPPIGGCSASNQHLLHFPSISKSFSSSGGQSTQSSGSSSDQTAVQHTPPRRKSIPEIANQGGHIANAGGKVASSTAYNNVRYKYSNEFTRAENVGAQGVTASSSFVDPRSMSIACNSQSSSISKSENPTPSITSNSPSLFFGRQLSIGGPSSNEAHVFNWRRPTLSQKRVREKLNGVIRSFGPTALSVARSPSVVFNSTTDVDFQSVGPVAPNGMGNGYENQLNHNGSSIGTADNGSAVPTTCHGSIEDVNITGLDLGTPSGREDTMSLDIFTHFDFLDREFDSDMEEGESKFQFGLRRPSDSASSANLTLSEEAKTEESSAPRKLFNEQTNSVGGVSNSGAAHQSRNNSRPQQVTITTHDGVSIDSSDDEEEEDDEDDDEDDDDDDDDDEEEGEDDEDEEDEDEEEEDEDMGVFSDVDQTVDESVRSAAATSAGNTLFRGASATDDSSVANSYYMNRELEVELVDINLVTRDLQTLDRLWPTAISDVLKTVDQTALTESGDNLEQNVFSLPNIFVGIIRYIQEFVLKSKNLIIHTTDLIGSSETQMQNLLAEIQTSFERLKSTQKALPLVLFNADFKNHVMCSISARHRRTFQRNLSQAMLEISEAVLNTRSTIQQSQIISQQLQDVIVGTEHVTISVKHAGLSFCKSMVRAFLQISLLFNHMDKLHNLISTALQTSQHSMSDGATLRNVPIDLSAPFKQLAAFLATARFEDTSGTLESSISYLGGHSNDNSVQLAPNFAQKITHVLSQPNLTSQSFLMALSIIRQRSSVAITGSTNADVSANGCDRLLLISMLWNSLVLRELDSNQADMEDNTRSSSFAFYSLALEDENSWMDELDRLTEVNARLRGQLSSLSNEIGEVSTQHENSNTNSLVAERSSELINMNSENQPLSNSVVSYL